MAGFEVAAGEAFDIFAGEFLGGIGSLRNDGVICGEGGIGLDWAEPIVGEAAEDVTCEIVEENVPVLDAAAEVEEGREFILVRCGDVGGVRYWAECLDVGALDVELVGGAEGYAGRVGVLSSVVDYGITVSAVNSRGSRVSASVSAAVYSGAERYLVVKQPLPLKPYFVDEEIWFLARIVERGSGVVLGPGAVSSVRCSCYKLKKNVGGVGRVAVPGLDSVELGRNCLAGELSVVRGWRRDELGGNFRYLVGKDLGDWLGGAGVFDVVFSIGLRGESERVEFEWSVIVEGRGLCG